MFTVHIIITTSSLEDKELLHPHPASVSATPPSAHSSDSTKLYHALRANYRVTQRDVELALLALSDKTCAEIAVVRKTTRNTIKTDYQRLYRKFGINSRKELCALVATHLHML